MRSLLVVLVIVCACKSGAKDAPAAEPPAATAAAPAPPAGPPATAAECEAAARNVMRIGPDGPGEPTTEAAREFRADSIAAYAAACTDGAWPREVASCLAEGKDPTAFGACERKLTPPQRAAVQARMNTAIKKHMHDDLH